MPRSGSGEYSKPPGTTAIPNAVITSALFNGAIDDLVADANAARPISAGGTGSGTKAGAQASLGVVPQASTSDATAGSLLLVGGFGWGGAPLAMPGEDCNSITVTGLYAGTADVTANMPVAASSFTILHIPTSQGALQIAYRTDGRTWRRVKVAADWFAWRVQESVRDSGSSGAGNFIVYESGLIQCWQSFTFTAAISTAYYGGFRSAEQTWTFPTALFSEVPRVFATANNGTAFGASCTTNASTTQAFFAATAIASQSSAARAISLFATGF
jgi:hypothetical protein